MRNYGMGRVYRDTGCRTWSIAYSYRGTEQRERTGSRNRADAVRLLKQRLAEIQGGRFVGPVAGRVTVRELLADLDADYAVKQRASRRNLPSHIAALRSLLDVRAADVTTARLNRLVETWRAQGYADATINKVLGTLLRAYSVAQKTTPPKVQVIPTRPRLREDNVRAGYTDRATFVRLLAALVARDPVVADIIEWSWWTAMRWGAVARLEWSAFDRETTTFTVPGTVQKNGKPVKFTLNAALRAVIDRAQARRLERGKQTGALERLVFWRIYDGQPRPGLTPGDAVRVVDFRKVWRSACKEAGCVGLWPNDLRRTGLRNARRAGVDRRTAMLVSGHRTEATYERYLIDREEETGTALAQVEAYVETLPTRSERGR